MRYENQTKNFQANRHAIHDLTDREKTSMFHELFGYCYTDKKVQDYIEKMLKELKK